MKVTVEFDDGDLTQEGVFDPPLTEAEAKEFDSEFSFTIGKALIPVAWELISDVFKNEFIRKAADDEPTND